MQVNCLLLGFQISFGRVKWQNLGEIMSHLYVCKKLNNILTLTCTKKKKQCENTKSYCILDESNIADK